MFADGIIGRQTWNAMLNFEAATEDEVIEEESTFEVETEDEVIEEESTFDSETDLDSVVE